MADVAPLISISLEVWQSKIAEYMAKMNVNMREALYEEWPLLIRKMMDFTPPFKTKGAPGSSDLSIGRAAVSHDIYKTMRPFDPAVRTSKVMQRIVINRDIELFNLMAARSKSVFMKGARAVAFSESLHTSARQKPGRGRVAGHDRNRVVLGSDAALLTAYVTKIQKRVGYAKSGWLKALQLVGGDAPGYVTSKGTSGGDVIDDHANEDFPSITAINRTPWAVRKDEGDRIKADAYASRIQSIIAKIRAKERLAAQAAKLAA